MAKYQIVKRWDTNTDQWVFEAHDENGPMLGTQSYSTEKSEKMLRAKMEHPEEVIKELEL